MEIGKMFVCKLCKKVVLPSQLLKHLKEEHKPLEFYDPLLNQEWEEE